MSPCVTTVHLRSTDAKLRIVGALVLFCFWICFEWRTEHFDDMCGQTFFDFLVARNPLRNLVCRIGIPIVLLAVRIKTQPKPSMVRMRSVRFTQQSDRQLYGYREVLCS